MGICDHWSTDPPGLQFDPPGLYCESLDVLDFDFNAGPDPAINSNADPDPASKNNAGSCGSGSATLILTSTEDLYWTLIGVPVSVVANTVQKNSNLIH